MRKHAVPTATDVCALPFLYQTRTLLRPPSQYRISTRQVAGSASHHIRRTAERSPRPESRTQSFLKAKASASKQTSSGKPLIPSTITAAERKVFDGIFNEIAGKSSTRPDPITPSEREGSVDHDEILAIFSSAVTSHHAEKSAIAELNAKEAAKRGNTQILEDQEQFLQRYPKPLRKAARRAAAAAFTTPAEDSLRSDSVQVDLDETKPEHQVIWEGLRSAGDQGRSESWVNNAKPDTQGSGTGRPLDLRNASKTSGHSEISTATSEVQESRRNWTVDRGLVSENLDYKKDPTSESNMRSKPHLKGLEHGILATISDREQSRLLDVPSSVLRLPKDAEDDRRGLRPSIVEEEINSNDRDPDNNPSAVQPASSAGFNRQDFGGRGLRPSFLTTRKREEDIASFAEHYGAVRPSFIRRAEDAAAVEQRLQHDPEAVFQGTIHRYCREQMEKMGDEFQVASRSEGDVGIWNTCLARIFPMIDLLDTSLRTEKLGARGKAKIPTKVLGTDVASPALTDEASPGSLRSSPRTSPLPDLPPYVPPLYIISRLYPAALLLAFRLLRKDFPTSPLALALLPHIRSMGPTSYVLGASVQFYNALIELRWDVYSDLRSVDSLLGEMERSGVEFDVGTWNALVRIAGERVNDLHDEGGGARGNVWWERPQNVKWFQRVAVEWKTVVAARLREQGLGADISEREYGTVPAMQLGAEATGEQTVWL